MWTLGKRNNKNWDKSKDKLITKLATWIVFLKLRFVGVLSRMERKLSQRQKRIMLISATSLAGLYFLFVFAATWIRPMEQSLPNFDPKEQLYPGLSPPIGTPNKKADSLSRERPPTIFDSLKHIF